MYVNTNYSSLVAREAMRVNGNDLTKAMERLSSGLRINGAADDAAGLAISERMTSQITGMNQAKRNAQDGVSLIQTAEGSMGVISDILQRIRELSIQADNGTNSDPDKASIQGEIVQLIDEAQHISETGTFNGINLLDAAKTITLHISDKATDVITFDLIDVQTTALGTTGAVADIDVTVNAQEAITVVDEALDQLSTARADLGAVQNRLEFISDNLSTTVNNTEASRSRIKDADMAAESSNLTKAEILSQTSMSMLGRANKAPQQVLTLLQG